LRGGPVNRVGRQIRNREGTLKVRVFVASSVAVVASLVLAASASAVNLGEAAQVTVNTDNGGTGCELREAIDAVIANVSQNGCTLTDPSGLDDHVTFAPGMSGQTITLNGTQLFVDDSVDVLFDGPGMNQLTISGNDLSRIFEVPTTHIDITGMSLVHGLAPMTGGISEGGAIDSGATGNNSLILTDVKVANSAADMTKADSTTAFADGGAIHAQGTTSISQSVITGNSATASQTGTTATSGAEARGGAIFNQDDLSITDSTISDNQATATTDGIGGSQVAATGGIRSDGLLGLDGSTVSGNIASANATSMAQTNVRGGIYQNNAGSGQAGIEQSTIAANTTSTSGGVPGVDVGGLELHNETVIRGSTIAFNGPSSLAADVDGANINNFVPSSEVEDSIIADPRGTGQNCSGTLTSTGYNDDSTGGAGSCFATPQSSDLTSDPLLVAATGGVASNGGLTQTIALQPTSPVIDQGSALDLTNPTQDQRGASFARPVDFSGLANATGGDGSDIGSFEVQQACSGFTQLTPSTACPTPPSPPAQQQPTTPPPTKKKCKKAKKGASSAKKKCKKKKK
jgi:hypothetical protein